MAHSNLQQSKISGMDISMAMLAMAGALLLIFATPQSQAQTFTVLHDFTGRSRWRGPVCGPEHGPRR